MSSHTLDTETTEWAFNTLCGSAGLCGGSASGKTTVANKIIEALDVPWVVLLSMDSFYKVRDYLRSFFCSAAFS